MDHTIYVAKTKALISFAVTAKLICVFVFAYAKCWFSHDEAHIRGIQYFHPSRLQIACYVLGTQLNKVGSSSEINLLLGSCRLIQGKFDNEGVVYVSLVSEMFSLIRNPS